MSFRVPRLAVATLSVAGLLLAGCGRPTSVVITYWQVRPSPSGTLPGGFTPTRVIEVRTVRAPATVEALYREVQALPALFPGTGRPAPSCPAGRGVSPWYDLRFFHGTETLLDAWLETTGCDVVWVDGTERWVGDTGLLNTIASVMGPRAPADSRTAHAGAPPAPTLAGTGQTETSAGPASARG